MSKLRFGWLAGIVLSLVLLSAPHAAAQCAPGKETSAAAKPAPTVDHLLDKWVTALGGKAALERITSRTATGTFEASQGSQVAAGEVELYAKAPNKSALVIYIDGFGYIRNGYNGAVAWASNPQIGVQESTGEALEAARRSADFYFPLKFKSYFPKTEVKGPEKAGERDAWVIEADPGSGKPTRFFFDAETGLLVRRESEQSGPMGTFMAAVVFEDYRAVDGIKVAFVVKQIRPTFPSTIKLTEVKHNVAVDDAKFEKPEKP